MLKESPQKNISLIFTGVKIVESFIWSWFFFSKITSTFGPLRVQVVWASRLAVNTTWSLVFGSIIRRNFWIRDWGPPPQSVGISAAGWDGWCRDAPKVSWGKTVPKIYEKSPWKRTFYKGNVTFQPSIFRGICYLWGGYMLMYIVILHFWSQEDAQWNPISHSTAPPKYCSNDVRPGAPMLEMNTARRANQKKATGLTLALNGTLAVLVCHLGITQEKSHEDSQKGL